MFGLADATAHIQRRPLRSSLPPYAAIRALVGLRSPFALTGAWAGGGLLMGADPLAEVRGSQDIFDTLDYQPRVELDCADGGVGGGWFGHLGYQLGRAVEAISPPKDRPHPLPDGRLAFYDHVVRFQHGRWIFEALWTVERADALDEAYRMWSRRLVQPPCDPPCDIGRFSMVPSQAEHEAAIVALRVGVGRAGPDAGR